MMLSSGPIPKMKKKINHTAHTVKRALHLDSLATVRDSLSAKYDSLAGRKDSSLFRAEKGKISFYGKKHKGRKTASGEIYDMNEFTAAHKTYPFGTKVRVTNLANNKSVILKINDRLPKTSRRMIDVSFKAAQELGMMRSGLAKGEITVLEWGQAKYKNETLKEHETSVVVEETGAEK